MMKTTTNKPAKPNLQIICTIENGLVLGLADIQQTEGHDDSLPYQADIYIYQPDTLWQKIGAIWNDGWGAESHIRYADPLSGPILIEKANSACKKHKITFMDESFQYEFKLLCDCIAAQYLDCDEQKLLPEKNKILVYRFDDDKVAKMHKTNIFSVEKARVGLDKLLIDIYARTYTYSLGNTSCHGTEYFHDKEMTQLLCRNPYRILRKTRQVTINGWKYLAHYVKTPAK